MTITFPDTFVFGAATAAYQIEGAVDEDGRTPSIWDTFSHLPGTTRHGDNGDVACDHYHRVDGDLDLVGQLGLEAYRFSVSWSRVMPEAGTSNRRGLDFYERIVDELLRRDVQPVVTLYHWDLPEYLQDKGGWASRDVTAHFAEYASVVGARLGDRPIRWVTLNEPYCSSFIGHSEGAHAPGIRDEATALTVAHHLLLAHGLGLQALRAYTTDPVGISLSQSDMHPASSDEVDREASTRADLVENRLFLEPLFHGRYPDDYHNHFAPITGFGFIHDGDFDAISTPVDWLGINYYEQHFVSAVAGRAREFRKDTPAPPVTAAGIGIRPDGLSAVLRRVAREWTGDLPLWITENGLALHDYVTPDGECHDPERIEYLDAHFRAAHAAMADGVPLQGYLVWSLLDNFEWAEGYALRFGLIHVDYATQTRRPKDSARWLHRLIRERSLPEPSAAQRAASRQGISVFSST